MKRRIYLEKKRQGNEMGWSEVEKLRFIESVNALYALKAIDEEQKEQLQEFNSTRNDYIHYKIEKLVSQVFIEELPSVNVQTGEVLIQKDVFAKDMPILWFSAKQRVDRERMVGIAMFCLGWANRLLGTPNVASTDSPDQI